MRSILWVLAVLGALVLFSAAYIQAEMAGMKTRAIRNSESVAELRVELRYIREGVDDIKDALK